MNPLADWFAFIITCGEEAVAWLSNMSLYGVSLGGIIVGFFLLGFIMRAIIARA